MSKVAGSVFFLIIVHGWGDFFLKVLICIGKLGLLNSSQVSSVSPDITFTDPDPKVKVVALPSEYPQGAEKTLVYTTLGRIIPDGKLPSYDPAKGFVPDFYDALSEVFQ